MGIIGVMLFVFLVTLFFFELLNWFLLFHLTYYSVSNRIRMLRDFITITTEEKVQRIKKLRLCGYIFDQITQAVNELNSTFSFSVLVFLTILMIICATSLFIGLFSLSAVVREARNTYLFLSFVAIVFILIILTAAESPIVEVFITH
jgi:hypothetical protein